ncbi:MAG: baseplate J/gp47 family protein [Solibacillus sp.]
MNALPEVNFTETNPQIIVNQIVGTYEELSDRKLAEADPLRLIFLTLACVITQQNVKINDSAKQNLLYYARDGVLDHKGAAWQTPRLGNTRATTVLRLVMSQPLTAVKVIPKGTLVTADGEVFFETTVEEILPLNTVEVEIPLQCTLPGTIGNGYEIGEINTLVQPLSYVESVMNLYATQNGSEREENEPYRERIRQAPEKITTAGSIGSYEYHAKSASSLITDVFVDSPEPGELHVSVLLSGGMLPSPEVIQMVEEKLCNRRVRPLTDYVVVKAPASVPFHVNVSYFIPAGLLNKAAVIAAVEKAIDDYILWQSSKIGRDINPSRLISDCIRAGAKRVDVIAPNFTPINEGEVAQIASKNVTFGGEEND